MLVVNGANPTLGVVPATFALTDAGLAGRAEVTDGTRAILFTAFTPVPEPGAVLGLEAAGLAGAAAARRRQPAG